MKLENLQPFIRYAQNIRLNKNTLFNEVVSLEPRFFYCLNGKAEVKVNGTLYSLEKCDVLIVNSGVPYRVMASQSGADLCLINFDLDQSANTLTRPINPVKVKDFSNDKIVSRINVDYPTKLNEFLLVKNVLSVQSRIVSIVNEYQLQLVYFKEKMSGLLANCILDVVRSFSAILNLNENDINGKIIRYVNDNFTKPLSNLEIGKIFNYHPNYISALVKTATGKSLHKYLLHLRLLKAVSLLQNTAMPVNEIAIECGFCDLAYFSGYFKRAYGVSPSKFRNV
jgi:YesN/AraC family two-component response regulator